MKLYLISVLYTLKSFYIFDITTKDSSLMKASLKPLFIGMNKLKVALLSKIVFAQYSI